jgi:hypothetical protein
MDGGLDGVIKKFLGPKIQTRVQSEIARLYQGTMPLGYATCVATGAPKPPWLISTPTMVGRSDDVSDTLNVALACAAAFQAVRMQNAPCPGASARWRCRASGPTRARCPWRSAPTSCGRPTTWCERRTSRASTTCAWRSRRSSARWATTTPAPVVTKAQGAPGVKGPFVPPKGPVIPPKGPVVPPKAGRGCGAEAEAPRGLRRHRVDARLLTDICHELAPAQASTGNLHERSKDRDADVPAHRARAAGGHRGGAGGGERRADLPEGAALLPAGRSSPGPRPTAPSRSTSSKIASPTSSDDLAAEGFTRAGVRAMLDRINSPSARRRALSALRLGWIGDRVAVDPLLDRATLEGTELSCVVEALGRLGDSTAVPLARAEAARKLLSRGARAPRRCGRWATRRAWRRSRSGPSSGCRRRCETRWKAVDAARSSMKTRSPTSRRSSRTST